MGNCVDAAAPDCTGIKKRVESAIVDDYSRIYNRGEATSVSSETNRLGAYLAEWDTKFTGEDEVPAGCEQLVADLKQGHISYLKKTFGRRIVQAEWREFSVRISQVVYRFSGQEESMTALAQIERMEDVMRQKGYEPAPIPEMAELRRRAFPENPQAAIEETLRQVLDNGKRTWEARIRFATTVEELEDTVQRMKAISFNEYICGLFNEEQAITGGNFDCMQACNEFFERHLARLVEIRGKILRGEV